MGRFRRGCAMVTMGLVLVCWLVSPSQAQLKEAARLNDQITALYGQGKYAEAIPLAQRELSIYQKALGPNHPSVAVAVTWLAELYLAQGRLADAEPLYKRALAIEEKAFGPDRPNILTALTNLASFYYAQRRYTDAEPLYKRALAKLRQ